MQPKTIKIETMVVAPLRLELKCRFIHPKEICKEHMDNQNCSKSNCNARHPKQCKWFASKYGCRRSNCEFSHVTHASNDGYECSGCKDIWTDMTCVKKHIIENQSVYFCLNCDDWIQFKSKVFDQGWTLLDKGRNKTKDHIKIDTGW